MSRASVRDLHLNTSAILKRVSDGESFIVEKHGIPVAELKPIQPLSRTPKLPDRERFISRLKCSLDSGMVLEEDRS